MMSLMSEMEAVVALRRWRGPVGALGDDVGHRGLARPRGAVEDQVGHVAAFNDAAQQAVLSQNVLLAHHLVQGFGPYFVGKRPVGHGAIFLSVKIMSIPFQAEAQAIPSKGQPPPPIAQFGIQGDGLGHFPPVPGHTSNSSVVWKATTASPTIWISPGLAVLQGHPDLHSARPADRLSLNHRKGDFLSSIGQQAEADQIGAQRTVGGSGDRVLRVGRWRGRTSGRGPEAPPPEEGKHM